MVLKTYTCKDLAAILKTFKVKFLVLFLLHNQLDVRKNKLIIALNLLGNFGVPLNNFRPKFVAFLSLPVWHFLFFFFLLFRR